MRTVTFIGLLLIGGALRHLAGMSPLDEKFFGVIMAIGMLMDVAEFIKKMTK